MFPVSLEYLDGTVQTYQTPCYGFLRIGEWEDDDYDFCDGFNRKLLRPNWVSPESEYPYGESCIWHMANTKRSSQNRLPLEELRYIWNSGSVLPTIGYDADGVTEMVYQTYNGPVQYVKNGEFVPPVDNVTRWTAEKGIEYSKKQFLLDLEKCIDAGRESALVFHDKGFVGVRADQPADRCLFYLMVDRELCDINCYKKSCFILDQMFEKGRNAMIAFLMSRLISVIEGAFGDELFYSGNVNDSCILPDNLICKGLGSKYLNPVAINWFQDAYTLGGGHLRDEDIYDDYDGFYFNSEYLSSETSPSMFNSVLLLENIRDNTGQEALVTVLHGESDPAIPLNRVFVRDVCKSSDYSRAHFWDLGSYLEDRKSSLLIPPSEWEPLIYKLLIGD